MLWINAFITWPVYKWTAVARVLLHGDMDLVLILGVTMRLKG